MSNEEKAKPTWKERVRQEFLKGTWPYLLGAALLLVGLGIAIGKWGLK